MLKIRVYHLFTAAIALTFTLPTQDVQAREPTKVYAHYMPWFRAEPTDDGQIIWEHWQWFGKGKKHDPDDILENGRHDIASVYYPLIGPYDGRDRDVLEYHMLTAKAAGIQGFIADWYGPGTYSDEVFTEMVKVAELYEMEVAICLEEKAFFPAYAKHNSREGAQDEAERHIEHVLSQYAVSPSYMRHEGQPVLYMFENSWAKGELGTYALSPEEMKNVLSRLEEPIVLVRTHFDNKYIGAVQGHFAWCGPPDYRHWWYNTAGVMRARGEIDYWAGSASPGFDDTGVWGWGNGPRITERRGTREYEETWEEALNAAPDAIQLVTWNDFEEGSTIEPAEEYGYRFIDLTEAYVEKLTGRSSRLRDNEWPLRIYKLRKAVASLPDLNERATWDAKLDDYAEAYSDGERFLMGWKLKRLERKIESLTAEHRGA